MANQPVNILELIQNLLNALKGAKKPEEVAPNIGALTLKKIWTNPSPSKPFAGTTLSASTLGVTLKNGMPIRIECRPSPTGGERFFVDCVVGADALCNFIANGNSNKLCEIRTRNVELRTTGIKFEDAYSKSITNVNTSLNNDQGVTPITIYMYSQWTAEV